MLKKKGRGGPGKNHHQWMLNPGGNYDEDENYLLHGHKVSFTHCLLLQVCDRRVRGVTKPVYTGNIGQHLDGLSTLISVITDIMSLKL